MIAYVDSSVLLRLVLRQPGALKEWRSIERAVASALVEVECLRTLDRLRLRLGRFDRDLAHRREVVFELLRTFEVVEIERQVLARAGLPLPTVLGILDAIHLATAALWRDSQHEELVMATHDAELARAARALGFRVVGVEPTPG